MGTQISARLVYGIALPGDVSDDEADEMVSESPLLRHVWAGTWNGGTRYLAAFYRVADLGEPQLVPQDELDLARGDHKNARLRAAWATLGRGEEMPEPGWFLAANCT